MLSSSDIRYVAARVAATYRPGWVYGVFVVSFDDEGTVEDLVKVFETGEISDLFDFLEEIDKHVEDWHADDWSVSCCWPC